MSSLPYPWSLLDPDFWMKMPLSGNVAQNYHPMTTWFSPQIDIQYLGNPKIEHDITANVAGYGSQLGTVIDVLMELTDGKEETDAVKRLRELSNKIEEVKKRYKDSLTGAAKECLDQLAKNDPAALQCLIEEYAKRDRAMLDANRK